MNNISKAHTLILKSNEVVSSQYSICSREQRKGVDEIKQQTTNLDGVLHLVLDISALPVCLSRVDQRLHNIISLIESVEINNVPVFILRYKQGMLHKSN